MAKKGEYAVWDFMRRKVVTVASGTTVSACAKVMAVRKVSSAVVMEKGRIAGIVTENDIARRVVAMDLNPKASKVDLIMTRDVVTIAPETPIYEAMIRLGQEKIKHLPVVKGRKLVGIITAMDILRVQPAYIDILSYPLL